MSDIRQTVHHTYVQLLCRRGEDALTYSPWWSTRVNNANFTAGRNNTFFNTVQRFINEEVEKYTELYFTQDDAEVLRVESDIQEAFFNAEAEQQLEYTRRQKNNDRVKMVHDALDSGIIIPDNVNIYDEEGQAYLRSQASEQGMTYEEYVRNAKKKKHAADKEEDSKNLKKQLEELAQMLIDGGGEIGDYNTYIENIRAEHEELTRVQIENALIETLRITKQVSEAASEAATKASDEASEQVEKLVSESDASTKIQKVARGVAGRQKVAEKNEATTKIQKVARGVAGRKRADQAVIQDVIGGIVDTIEENENTEVSKIKTSDRYKKILDSFKKKEKSSDWENRLKTKSSNLLTFNDTKYNIFSIKQIDENMYGVYALKEGGERRREYKFSFDDEAQSISHVPGTYLPKEAERKQLFSPPVTRARKKQAGKKAGGKKGK